MQVVCKKKNYFHTHGVSFSNFEKTRFFVFLRKRQKRLSVFFEKKYDYTVFFKKTKKTEKRHRLF